MHLSPSRTGPLDRSRSDWDSRHVLRLCLHVAAPPCPTTPNSSAASVDRLECGMRYLLITGSHPFACWSSVGPGPRPAATRLRLGHSGSSWSVFCRPRGGLQLGTLEQHRDGAGPGRQLTTVSALGWPLARPWGGSRFRRCRRRWPSAVPGSACGRGRMLGLDRETPGFHPEAVLVLIPRAPN